MTDPDCAEAQRIAAVLSQVGIRIVAHRVAVSSSGTKLDVATRLVHAGVTTADLPRLLDDDEGRRTREKDQP